MKNAYQLWLIGLVGLALHLGCDRTVQQVADSKQTESSPAKESDIKAKPVQTDLLQNEQGPSLLSQPSISQQSESPLGGTGSTDSLPMAREIPALPLPSDNATALEAEKIVAIKKSDDPVKMIQFINEIERSMEQLLVSNPQKDPEAYRVNALKLAKMKHAAAKHLSSLPTATPDQAQFATKTQLVALSHLSGLKDVQAAKQLEELATELSQSTDFELRQQGKIVLFGFLVQNFQNGVITDPQEIVQAGQQLVADERFRTRLEMTSLQHAMGVLDKLGYKEQITQLRRISFDAFANSTDQPLRFEAWNRLVDEHPARIAFLNALDPLETGNIDSVAALAAAKQLIADFPNAVTLEMLAGTIPNIEYAGQIEVSQQLAALIETDLPRIPKGESSRTTEAVLLEHKLRMNWLGRPFDVLDVVDLEGRQINLAEYQGKVILVDFWATWCLPCLKELPQIEQVYSDLHDKGFEVLSINMDIDSAKLQQFVKEHKTPWKIYRDARGDTRPLTQYFGITMFPHMILVGRDGKVTRLHVRGDGIGTAVRALLNQ